MSDQSDALNKKAVEAGLVNQATAVPKEVGDESARNELPWVLLPMDGRQAWAFASELGAIVANQPSPLIYRYKDGLATVEWNQAKHRYEIAMMDPHDFRTWVEHFCTPHKVAFNKHGATKVKQTMGVDDAKTCLRSRDFCLKQPQLLRVNPVRLPIMRASGAIELLPAGYDAESCILTLPPSWEYDETMDVTAAVSIIEDLVREFPFQDARSRTVAIAMFLAQFGYFLQPLSSRRLGFLMNANSSRSGKTLLVELALTIPWLYAAIDAMPETGKELRDRLDTAVREAKPYLVLDDLDVSFVRSGILNAFMTAPTWGGRKFHAQEEFSEAKTPVIFLTGNNIETTPDITGRTLTCELFTAEADVASRKIERPIDADWIRTPAVHQQVCSALWTLIRHWRDSGRKHEGRQVLGYQPWSKIFGGIMMAAGLGDPCEPSQTDGIGNTEYQDMVALITRMAEGVTKVGEFEFSDIVQFCRELNCFEHALDGKLVRHKDGDEDYLEFELTSKSKSILGKNILGKYGGKVFLTKDGKKVVFDKRGKNRHRRYTLEVVGGVKSPAA